MATTRKATTTWNGGLADGNGKVALQSSGIGTYDVSWAARSEEPNGKTSSEELIAAAQSSCFSMALSNVLGKQGHPPTTLETSAKVHVQPGKWIAQTRLSVRGTVDGVDNDTFAAAAQDAKVNCPVGQALTGV